MFLSLLDLDPDSLVRGTDLVLSSSKNRKKKLDSYCFVTSLKNDVNVPSKSNKQENFLKISFLLAS
jgi:hypothetical protein